MWGMLVQIHDDDARQEIIAFFLSFFLSLKSEIRRDDMTGFVCFQQRTHRRDESEHSFNSFITMTAAFCVALMRK
jgi:hypothetical protein